MDEKLKNVLIIKKTIIIINNYQYNSIF